MNLLNRLGSLLNVLNNETEVNEYRGKILSIQGYSVHEDGNLNGIYTEIKIRDRVGRRANKTVAGPLPEKFEGREVKITEENSTIVEIGPIGTKDEPSYKINHR